LPKVQHAWHLARPCEFVTQAATDAQHLARRLDAARIAVEVIDGETAALVRGDNLQCPLGRHAEASA
jgi:hypothetical protein